MPILPSHHPTVQVTPELQRLKPGANVVVPAPPDDDAVATVEGLGLAMGLSLA